jgi:gamma-glutamyltranspeptidase/glutathione hydrolase
MSYINPNPFTTRPEIEGTFGVVTSTHWIGTAVGMSILEKGGNAFDAAVATAFTLQVVEPHLNGPGGDVPVIIFDARRGRPEVVCGQGPAPAGATIAHYRSLGIDMVPGTGLLAACVPGMFDAWMLLLRDYGTMRPADVIAPAIEYARHGHPLVERACATIATVEALFREHWPTSAAVYLPGGRVPEPATLFTNPALADTYARVLREAASAGGDRERQIERARQVWSQGFVAEAIDRFCRTQEIMDVSGERHRGVLTADDMVRWQAHVEAPLTYDYGRYTLCKAGPWSQGPVMLQQLALLKGFKLDGLDPAGPDFIHLQVECAKLAYADRETFYGDPKFVDVPMQELLSDSYNAARRKLVTDRASLELRPGAVAGHGAKIAVRHAEGQREAVGSLGAGEPTVGRLGEVRGDTVHFDIVDRAGNMVSATPSGGWLQSSPVIPELGFGLGTRAQMFWLEEGHPAALAPGKRPRTTLSPSLALRDGEPYLAWGTPGGDQQDQWTTQFFLRHVHAGLNLQEAIDAPAWHSEHFPISFWPRTARPGVLVVEGRVPPKTIEELRRRGHVVEVGPDWSEGRLTAASRVGPPPPIRAACRATRPGGEDVFVDRSGFGLRGQLVPHPRCIASRRTERGTQHTWLLRPIPNRGESLRRRPRRRPARVRRRAAAPDRPGRASSPAPWESA